MIARLRTLLHKALRLAVLAGVVAGLFFAGRELLLDPELFPLERMRITSKLERVTQEQLRVAVDPYTHEGMFGMDVKAVRAAVMALPWVEDAVIRRAWPDAVMIRVTEQRPLARWGDIELINRQGERFQVPDLALDMARLNGPDGSEMDVIKSYLALDKSLAGLSLKLAELEMDQRQTWRLTLSNGLQLVLGREDIERRVARFIHAYPRVIEPELARIELIDLRYPNGLAIAWRVVNSDERIERL